MKFYPDALKNEFVPYTERCQIELSEIIDWLTANKSKQGTKEFAEKIERAESLHEIVFDL
tara:strand:- start:16 stop:195 length:180 start_codon:yes stop_codon:yes gene_type:complete